MQLLRQHDQIGDGPAAFHPIGRRDAHTNRLVRGEDAAAEIENFQRQPYPVFKAAAVLIVALIDDRGEELTDQIAVGEMQLDDVNIDLRGPAHGIAPIEFDPLYVLKIHDRGGCVEIVIVKRRRNRNPTALLDRNRFADHEDGLTDALRPAFANWMPNLVVP